ncbi:hypothetical protein PV326_013907 [Microctonus aethiopoides]|nr:hypothetical protein PV326_013907 [Microctonus aethiopoides]
MSTCTLACFHLLLFCLILFEEFHIYNGQSSETSENESKEILQSGNNGQFVVIDTTKSWRDAVLYCDQNGMRIGEVNTIEEAQLVSQIMLKTRPAAIESAWIGGSTHLIGETDNSWRWLSTCEIIADDNELWLKKPSDIKDEISFQSESSHARCLLLDRHLNIENQLFYIESTCDRKRGFICQKLNSINNTKLNTKSTAEDLQCSLEFFNISDSIHRSIDMATTLSADMTSENFISSTMISPVRTTSNNPPLTTTTMATINSPPTETRKKKKNKIKNRFPTTTAIATEPIVEEDYSDYKMWELGRKQMEGNARKKQTTNENKKNNVHLTENNEKNSEKMKTKESRKNFITTNKPKVKQQSTKHYLMRLRPVKPLRLYYAFEGPMIGGLTATPLPQVQYGSEMNLATAVPCYHKYISRRKYNEVMSNKTPA